MPAALLFLSVYSFVMVIIYEILYRGVSLEASDCNFVIVNDRDFEHIIYILEPQIKRF